VVDLGGSAPAEEQRTQLVAAQMAPELRFAEAVLPTRRVPEIAAEDSKAADALGRLRHPIEHHRE
jgi:hypothetical protein